MCILAIVLEREREREREKREEEKGRKGERGREREKRVLFGHIILAKLLISASDHISASHETPTKTLKS